MSVRVSDVWVVTQPKCGTTWTQEMVWQIANNVDMNGGKTLLTTRFPFLEFDTLMDQSHLDEGLKRYFVTPLLHMMIWW